MILWPAVLLKMHHIWLLWKNYLLALPLFQVIFLHMGDRIHVDLFRKEPSDVEPSEFGSKIPPGILLPNSETRRPRHFVNYNRNMNSLSINSWVQIILCWEKNQMKISEAHQGSCDRYYYRYFGKSIARYFAAKHKWVNEWIWWYYFTNGVR